MSDPQAAIVDDLLRGADLDVAAAGRALGYRLAQHHAALCLTLGEPRPRGAAVASLRRPVTDAATRLGCTEITLFTVQDQATATAWLPLGSEPALDTAGLIAAIEAWRQPVRVGIGSPCHGMAGFRRSHRQALQADRVNAAAGRALPSAVAYDDIVAIALQCHDLEATRGWVADTLGDLAHDTEPQARRRATLRAYLAAGASHTAAARRLTLHKNTVVYRVQQAERHLPRPLGTHRLAIESALEICHWLGRAVLTPAPTPDAGPPPCPPPSTTAGSEPC